MYEGLKYFYLFIIGVSVVMLLICYVFMMMNLVYLECKFFKIFLYVNDMLLLFFGIGLIFIIGFILFIVVVLWMIEKFICVLVYIVLGFFVLKLGCNKLLCSFVFFGVLGWLVMVGKIVVVKVLILFG